MTLLEELNQAIEENKTAEDIQSLLGKHMIPKSEFNKVNETNKELKSQLGGYEGQVNELTEQLETVKTSNMDEQELIRHQLEKAQGQIKGHAIEKNRMTAENKFVGAGFKEDEYKGLLEQIVSEDSEKTTNLVDSFLNLTSSKVKGAKEDQVDEFLGNNTPPKGDKLDEPLDDIDAMVAGFNDDLE